MRTIKNLDVPQNSEAKFPFSTIQNETDTLNGTPVVEEIYGDLLTNIYKLLQSVGITPTETQDSDTSQYQILQALKQLPNSLNDIEQVLSLTGTTWSVSGSFPFDFLPNKYFLFARASDNYVGGVNYNFQGYGGGDIPFTSNGFKASDELLLILDIDEIRAYSLSALYGTKEEVFSVLGQPLSYNDSDKMYYFEDGKLFSDSPSVDDLQLLARNYFEDSTFEIVDMVIISGYVLCLGIGATLPYYFIQFPLNDLIDLQLVSVLGDTLGGSTDYKPYLYVQNSQNVFVSNELNQSADDNKFTRLFYNPLTSTLTYANVYEYENSFTKTTNAVVIGNSLVYTLISGNLKRYVYDGSTVDDLGTFPNALGRLINFNGNVYLLNGEVAKKWF